MVMKASGKVCLSTTVICGRKGRSRCIPGGKVTECRNRWGCRYQVDLTSLPERVFQERLQFVTTN